MFRTSRLTREQQAQLDQLNVRPEHAVYPLMDLGYDADTAIAITRARCQTMLGIALMGNDIAFARDLGDPVLMLAIVTAGYDVPELHQTLRRGALTIDQVRQSVALGIDPNGVISWIATGRPLADLADPIAALPHLTPAAVAGSLALGLSVDDMSWLTSTRAGALGGPLASLRSAADDDPDGAARFAALDSAHRRFVLVATHQRGFTLTAALALDVAVHDAPWLDTLTSLIADGTPVHEALALARADHSLEQQRTRVVAASRASGPSHVR